ncbi:cytosine permease [Nocardioides sp. B-3]|nr:cytosine permease [Nocardioides sp. B-3]UUZ60330.1 cytosine permease [Nocardioides sp. B-3]
MRSLANRVGYLADLGGVFGPVILLAVIAGKLTGNTLSSYGGYMSVATIVTSLTRQSRIEPRHRAIYVGVISAVAPAIALAATDNFLGSFTDFLLFLLYFMTPWSAVNLVDYYWVRREKYDVAALFDADGIYGRFNRGAFVAYATGVLIQIPFMHSTLYTGPVANWLGGAEVAPGDRPGRLGRPLLPVRHEVPHDHARPATRPRAPLTDPSIARTHDEVRPRLREEPVALLPVQELHSAPPDRLALERQPGRCREPGAVQPVAEPHLRPADGDVLRQPVSRRATQGHSAQRRAVRLVRLEHGHL